MQTMRILYEDNHIIVVVKPANMPSQADDSGDTDLLTAVKAYIKEKYAKPGEVYCGLVHRLDRPVGGVMVFARTSKAASRLMPQFAEKNRSGAKKRYAALVMGVPPKKGRLEDHILRDLDSHSSRVVPEGTEGAKPASLDFVRVKAGKYVSLLDIDLHTGRHHQIRVQLANAGFPLWGDQRYNVNSFPGQPIGLFAYCLSIEHPVTHERMTFTALPEDSLWDDYINELKLMTAGLEGAYTDERVLIINKPAGMTVAAADGGEDNLEARLNGAFGGAYPVHRLDAQTCGLVIFARDKETKAALDSLIRGREIEKTYRMIVMGRPSPAEGRLELYAVKDAARGLVAVYDESVRGSVPMITDYRTVKTAGGVSLVEATLITGRTHQLRASFAHIGCPILGDDRYGSREFNRDPEFRPLHRKNALCLCAVRIRFPKEMPACLIKLAGRTVETEAPFEL